MTSVFVPSRPLDLALRLLPGVMWPFVIRDLGIAASTAPAALTALTTGTMSTGGPHLGLTDLAVAGGLAMITAEAGNAGRLPQLIAAAVAATFAIVARSAIGATGWGDAAGTLYVLAVAAGLIGAPPRASPSGLVLVARVAVAAVALQWLASAGGEAFGWAWLAIAGVVGLTSRTVMRAAGDPAITSVLRPRQLAKAIVIVAPAVVALILPLTTAAQVVLVVLVVAAGRDGCDGLARVIAGDSDPSPLREVSSDAALIERVSAQLAVRLPCAVVLVALLPRSLRALAGPDLLGGTLDGSTAAAAGALLVAASLDDVRKRDAVIAALIALGGAFWASPTLILLAGTVAGVRVILGLARANTLPWRRLLPGLVAPIALASVWVARRPPSSIAEVAVEVGALAAVSATSAYATWQLTRPGR